MITRENYLFSTLITFIWDCALINYDTFYDNTIYITCGHETQINLMNNLYVVNYTV